MWSSSGTATLPMVLMFLPCPWRGDGGPGSNEGGRQKRGRCDETEKERHLLLISMGKFPRSRRLGRSPPDRAGWLLRGSPFVSRLPQAPLALIQRNPFERLNLCLHHSGTPPTSKIKLIIDHIVFLLPHAAALILRGKCDILRNRGRKLTWIWFDCVSWCRGLIILQSFLLLPWCLGVLLCLFSPD